jgi:hypothetical protein
MYSLAGPLPKSPVPFFILEFEFYNAFSYILGFCLKVPWTVRSEAQKSGPLPSELPRVLWELLRCCDTVWSSKSQSEQSCSLERQMKKKHFRDKSLDSIRETADTQKYKSNTKISMPRVNKFPPSSYPKRKKSSFYCLGQ